MSSEFASRSVSCSAPVSATTTSEASWVLGDCTLSSNASLFIASSWSEKPSSPPRPEFAFIRTGHHSKTGTVHHLTIIASLAKSISFPDSISLCCSCSIRARRLAFSSSIACSAGYRSSRHLRALHLGHVFHGCDFSALQIIPILLRLFGVRQGVISCQSSQLEPAAYLCFHCTQLTAEAISFFRGFLYFSGKLANLILSGLHGTLHLQ